MEEAINRWQFLAGEAKAGRLRLDESVASECHAACEKLIGELKNMRQQAEATKYVSGFGGFDCADDLMKMFRELATGKPDSIDAVILKHIEVVGLIRDTIGVSVKTIQEQDQANSKPINAL